MTGDHCVARVIARPFIGAAGAYTRTHRRRDFAIEPTEPTVLDVLLREGVPVRGIGKIGDIFCWRGVTDSPHVTDNMDGFGKLVERVASEEPGFVFANLVDFDMLWGHRNDVAAYARGLEAVDARMPELLAAMVPGDLLLITSDHGCDPTTSGTDHSREYVPLLVVNPRRGIGSSLGVRMSFADVGQTILENYALPPMPDGLSFLAAITT
jgi:phosphopentomutase